MSDRRSILVGIAAVAVVGLIRAGVLFDPEAPSGIDGGNWLAFGTFPRDGMTYPPLVPAIFAVAVDLVGAGPATALAGAVATLAPAVAILTILAWAGHARTGALAALAIVASGAIGEVVAWGGYPQPTATALAMVALVAVARWLLVGGRLSLGVFAVAFAGVVATSHLVAIPSFAALVLVAVVVGLSADRTARIRAGTALALALIPFIVLAPTYGALLSTRGQSGTNGGLDPGRVLGFVWPVYFAILIAMPIAFGVAWYRRFFDPMTGSRDLAITVAATAAGASWVLAYVVSGEPRLLYDIYVFAVLGIAAIAPSLASSTRDVRWHRIGALLAVVAVIAVVANGLERFPAQVAYYRVLSADRYRAIEWLADNAPGEADTILVADVAGVPIGWWAEGTVGREVLFASDLRWLRFPEERDRAKVANTVLYGSPFPDAKSLQAVRDLGIQLVYLPSAGRFGVKPSDPPPGWHVVFSSGDAVVLAPGPGPIGRSDA